MSAASRKASLISNCVLAALASALLVAVISTPAAGQPPAKQPRTTKAKAGAATTPPIASRTWNSRGLGALIEGICVGVDGEYVRIVTGEIERRVPFELFHTEDLETIRAHFSVAEPFPKQATTDPAPRGECRMLHTIRGGVLPEAKVVGHEGDIIFLAGPDGLKYRVPFALFAEGVRTPVRDAITRLDGKPFIPADERSEAGKTRGGASGNSTTAKNNKSNSPAKKPEPEKSPGPTRPQPGQVVTPAAPTPKPPAPTPPTPMSPSATPSPPSIAKPKPDRQPIGEERVWSALGGNLTVKGRFLELAPPSLKIVTSDGQTRQLPIELLAPRDRQLAEALARTGKVGQIPDDARALAGEDVELVSITEGKPVFIRDGRTLVPLDPAGQPIEQRIVELAEDFRLLRLQTDHWVAATEKEIHLLDRATLRSKRKFELWKYKRINDLAPHPTRPACIVSVEQVSDQVKNNPAENQRIVIVDLTTGKVHEPAEAYGRWVRMHPGGKFLLSGFHSAFKAGPDREIDATGRVVPRLNVQHIDVLNRFRLDGYQLSVDGQFENAGANGQGLAMSADGGRICYLSFTGYPTFSYQVVAYRSTDFNEKPVTFAMKDRCDCKRLVFSPAGDLAASPTTGGAVLFDANTGKELEGALAANPALESAAIHDLAFTRDGQRMLFIASRGGSSLYAVTAPLQRDSRR